MITKEYLKTKQKPYLEAFKVSETECTQLHTMASELGVSRSALIRDGLAKVYAEYTEIKASESTAMRQA